MGSPRQVVWKVSLLLAVGLVSGCGVTEGRIESAVEQELPRLFGPARTYQVDFTGVSRNRVERVTGYGERIRVDNTPVLDRVDVRLSGVIYDYDDRQIERIQDADATVRVLASDLREFLEAHRNLQDVTVRTVEPDRLVIEARPQYQDVQIPQGATLTLTGRLQGEGSRIRYNVTDVQAAGIGLPNRVASLVSERINPVVDLGRMRLPLQVTDVRVDGRAIIADATGSLQDPIPIPGTGGGSR